MPATCTAARATASRRSHGWWAWADPRST